MSDSEALTIPEGKIRFYHHFRPALDVGRYEIEATQTLDLPGVEEGKDPKFTARQIFHVDGRRFTLGPGDVHAVYPPANQEGFFEFALPHVVLRKRALPWERNVGGGSAPRPWLALLLFHPGETFTLETHPFSVAARQTSNPDAGGLLRPDISVSRLDDPQGRAQCIDIPRATFERIAPTREDLPFLAHVREVNTGGKELLGLDVDGWFSVILGNRLPVPGLNTVHLVSLEGWVQVLAATAAAAPTIPAGTNVIRMVSLANWSFTVKARPAGSEAPRSFNDIAGALDVGPLRVRKTAATVTPGAGEAPLAALIDGAIRDGYVPLAYDLRNGEKSVAWYRGPLLPVRLEVTDKDPFPSAEAALIYDSRTGMFDVSYAVAWQIGRLLGLADSQFATNLFAWRQRGQQIMDRMLEQDRMLRRFHDSDLLKELDAIASAPSPEQRRLLLEFVRKLLDQHAFSRAIGQLVTGGLSAEGSPLAAVNTTPNGKQRLDRGMRSLTADEVARIQRVKPGPERARLIAELLLPS
jgi:hypothetical protein